MALSLRKRRPCRAAPLGRERERPRAWKAPKSKEARLIAQMRMTCTSRLAQGRMRRECQGLRQPQCALGTRTVQENKFSAAPLCIFVRVLGKERLGTEAGPLGKVRAAWASQHNQGLRRRG